MHVTGEGIIWNESGVKVEITKSGGVFPLGSLLLFNPNKYRSFSGVVAKVQLGCLNESLRRHLKTYSTERQLGYLLAVVARPVNSPVRVALLNEPRSGGR